MTSTPQQKVHFTPFPQESKDLDADEILKAVPEHRRQNKSLETQMSIKLAARKLWNASASLTGILFWIAIVQVVSLYLFTSGFLLTRPVFEDVSVCEEPPVENSIAPVSTCWSSQRPFKKTVMIVIDALRYDFVVPSEDNKYYHNSFPVLHELATAKPQNAFLSRFIADPPTTTLQRLKGLTTGSLPTFIDAGSNFAGSRIDEDNWISQLKNANRTVAFVGDDTWTALFRPDFDDEMCYPFDSLNVWDLHTVDNGVISHIFPLLENSHKWDLAIGHLLGVDHAGHRYGPNHHEMQAKLNQMDQFIRDLIEKIDDDTLLIVMGDHGMDSKGDHGGDTMLELESTLWMYSKRPYFAKSQAAGDRTVSQIDLVPTISLLLGLPIPYNSIGFPIAEAFLGAKSNDYKTWAHAAYMTAGQINRYRSKFSWSNDDSVLQDLWKSIQASKSDHKKLPQLCEQYARRSLEQFTEQWVKFDLNDMYSGIAVLLLSIAVVAAFVARIRTFETSSVFKNVSAATVLLGGAAYGGAYFTKLFDPLHAAGLGVTVGVLGSSLPMIVRFLSSGGLKVQSWWTMLSIVLASVHALSFYSNSFTIWEDGILHHLLVVVGVVFAAASFRLETVKDRTMALWHGAVFAILSRLVSFSRLCREEQGMSCSTTYYGELSSVNSPYALVVLFLLVLILPELIKSFYNTSASYTGSAPIWIGLGLRMGMFLATVYWTLDGVDTYGWDIPLLRGRELKTIKMMVARTALGAALVAGNYGWYIGALCVRVDVRKDENVAAKVRAAIMGYANVYGSYYFLLLINAFAAVIIVTKPLGGIVLAVLLYQILTLAELIQLFNLRSSLLGPVVLGLLGGAYFFSTGHHATLPAIQWEVGFIPVSTITFPFTHLAIAMNTFAPVILTTLAAPLVVLWKIPPNKNPIALQNRVGGIILAVVLYYTFIAANSMVSALVLRRHLMLWKIFAPRYMLAGVTLGACNVMAILTAMASGRVIGYINSLFG